MEHSKELDTLNLSITERFEKSKKLTVDCGATPNLGHFYPMSRIAIAL